MEQIELNTDDNLFAGNDEDLFSISSISGILEEKSIPNTALELESGTFSHVYRYVIRHVVRDRKSACKILFTLLKTDGIDPGVFEKKCTEFGEHIRTSFRKTDILTRVRPSQYFLFLADIKKSAISRVLADVVLKWYKQYGNALNVTYETEYIGAEEEFSDDVSEKKLVVVDDDPTILKLAGYTLSKAGYHVSALRSGEALLRFLENNVPDLILLDVKMPVMDGFETLKKLRSMERVLADIPIVFLTADESTEAEKTGLSLGATDFIKKPFVPEVLILRVKHILELETLQRYLSRLVQIKTEENQRLFVHVVQSLAEAIDAKDTYTNGHSGRVAAYSKEIARRSGFSPEEQSDIFMMGLLHDVGKIGIPDAVINKPAKLNEEEYEIIKSHPVMGARILQNIKEMPKLVTGARWHHERFDGTGYPDALKGYAIPEEARIIAVADAYDAMSSRRSYRDILPREAVQREITEGRGTQFDPKYADIMLEMIYQDTEYLMREF
ncbi:MAG: response regulator [Lachnospiraceae bacterium]|nr:response regulator [Lachnospiraceae bacterium]